MSCPVRSAGSQARTTPRRPRFERAEDTCARMRAGNPSDAEVVRWRDDGWVPFVPEVNVELVNLAGSPPV
jgi:hypothetical protein